MSERNGQPEGNLAELPPGWCWATVGELGEVRLGRQRSPKNRSEQHPTKYIRAANITWAGLDLSDVLDMEFKPAELGAYRLLPGDVLLSEASGSPGEVGKPAIWRGEIEDCCFQNTVIRFRPKAMPPEFPFVVFCHFARNGIFSRAGKGVGIHHLSADRFTSLAIPLAPLNEQRRIVEKIDELLSDLDAGVAALQRIKANLKRYRASVLKAAVEGRLTEQWRAKHSKTEPTTKLLERILAERRKKWEEDQLAKFATAEKEPPKNWQKKYVEPAAPDTSKLHELPKGWCWATVEQVTQFAKYGSSAKTSIDGAGVPVLRMGNIQDGSLDLTDLKYLPQDHDEFPDLLLREGDLLFNRTNSAELVGKSAIYHGNPSPCSYASYLIALRAVCGCTPELLCYYLNSWCGRAWIASVVCQQVGQANVNGTKLQALVFPLPPEPEQTQIIAEVERCFSNVAVAQAQVDANLKRAARLRQCILKQAFDGRLVPQDPTDEPADKLLERIRLERTPANGTVTPSGKPAKTRRAKATAKVPE
jgi:type I restriction enzyme S subunit